MLSINLQLSFASHSFYTVCSKPKPMSGSFLLDDPKIFGFVHLVKVNIWVMALIESCETL